MRRCLNAWFVGVLAFAVAGAALVECATGDLTPDEQACCLARAHACGGGGMDMDCCRTDQPPPDSVRMAPAKPSLAALTAPAVEAGPACLSEPRVTLNAVALAAFERDVLKLPHRPAYLRHATFLI